MRLISVLGAALFIPLLSFGCSDSSDADTSVGSGGASPGVGGSRGGTPSTAGGTPSTAGGKAAGTGGAPSTTGGSTQAMGGSVSGATGGAQAMGGSVPGTTGGTQATGGSTLSTGGSIPSSGPQAFDTNVPIGWAVVPGYELKSTTGGGGGDVVTVSSHGELSGAVGDDTARIVLVQGTISGGDINVGSNKTILGLGNDAKLSGFYLNMNGAHNVIIRNLSISGGTDAIAARQTTHLWIDHLDVSNCGDGLIDITRESDMYTLSWVRFSSHHKTMLLNGGSRHYEDRGKLNGTVHHCFFDGSDTRNPRAGFGKIHIFNDYNLKNGYGIGFHSESKVVAERNFFEDTRNAINQMYNEPGYDPEELGDAIGIDNVFKNASGDESTGVGFTVTDYYTYDFALDDANSIPEVVRAGAGVKAELGEIGLMPIPGQGAVGVSEPTLSWYTGTKKPDSYVVYFGTTADPPQVGTTTETSYNAGTLSAGAVYTWRVDQVTAGTVVPGKLWTFKAK